MGTHVYIFSTSDTIPTLRDLFGIAEAHGHRLKLSQEFFDDEDEEQEFLDQYLDSSDWREVSFDNQAGEWVLHMTAIKRGQPYFTETINDFRANVARREPSPAKEQVMQHFAATRVYYDIQLGLSGKGAWPAQDAIIGYFQSRDTDLLYLDNLNVYERSKQVILKP